jgi:hypothetical protein
MTPTTEEKAPADSFLLAPVVVRLGRWRTWIFHRDLLVAAVVGQGLMPFVSGFFCLGLGWGLLLAAAAVAVLLGATGQWIGVSEGRVVVWYLVGGVPWRRRLLDGDVQLRFVGMWDDLYGDGDELRLESASASATLCPLLSASELLEREIERALARHRGGSTPPDAGPYRTPGSPSGTER